MGKELRRCASHYIYPASMKVQPVRPRTSPHPAGSGKQSGWSALPWPQRPLRLPGGGLLWISDALDPLGAGRRQVDVKLVHSSRS